MTYSIGIEYGPNPERKKAAVNLLLKFKDIMDDVKARLPFNQHDWDVTETIFGKDEYTSGYLKLGKILVDVRNSEGGAVIDKTLKSIISETQMQADRLLDFSLSRETPYSNHHNNYGIILARKIKLFTVAFEAAQFQNRNTQPTKSEPNYSETSLYSLSPAEYAAYFPPKQF